MSNESIVMIFGFLATLIAVITPIIKLNTSITKLDTTIENIQATIDDQNENFKIRLDKHGREIDKLTVQVTRHDMFVENYEKKEGK